MSLSSSICIKVVFLFCIALLPACIVPNKEITQLKGDVEELKKENIRLRKAAGISNKEGGSRIGEIEKEIEYINRDLNKTKASSDARLNTLKTDFQRLMGRFEEITHQQGKVSEGNKSFMENADDRISSIETKLKALEVQMTDYALKLFDLNEITLSIKEKDEKKPELPADELYKLALDLIREGKTGDARGFFKQYLKDYPDGALANNAQFWVGESYYDEKEYEKAILEYDNVLKQYPSGGKVPAAMLKQGMAFRNLKDHETGNAVLKNLIKKYPDSDEVKKAKQILKRKKKTSNKTKGK